MSGERRGTASGFRAAKGQGRKLVCLTSYTVPVARVADRHADLILVGDSVGMVLYGFPDTLRVTLDMMILHGRAVVEATQRALVVVDMPFGTYQESREQAFRNAACLMAETGCGGVKMEGGTELAETVSFLTERGIPVMGHTGLQPQSVHVSGGYRAVGRDAAGREKVVRGAKALEQAGAFGLVLECVEESLAGMVSEKISIPVIGIGASVQCDGQILVSEDILGLTPSPHPRFVKTYTDLAESADQALAAFAGDVRAGAYPAAEHVYGPAGANQSRKSA